MNLKSVAFIRSSDESGDPASPRTVTLPYGFPLTRE
jgi:hypothetical protein